MRSFVKRSSSILRCSKIVLSALALAAVLSAQVHSPVAGVAAAQSTPAPAVRAQNPALLIVNKDYREIEKLPTAENDGRRLAAVLRAKPGFSPDLRPERDLAPVEFEQRWNDFREQVLAMKSNGVAVFYFSGHGVEIDNDSYLVPVDAPKGASEAQLRGMSASLRKLFREFRDWQEVLANRTQPVKVNGIFIIDACREIPLPAPTVVTKSTKGFAPVVAAPVAPPAGNTPSGMIVLYAASAGQVAHTVTDGSDPTDKESVYTRHLSRLLESGLAVQTSATRVRWEVHKEVAANPGLKPQTPAFYDELLEQIDVWGKIPAAEDQSSPPVTIRRPVEPSEPVWECETCPHLVVVPPGRFKMGAPPTEREREPYEGVAGRTEKDDTRLTVTISKPFAIGTREVTRGEYQAYIRDKYARSCPSTLAVCTSGESLNRPVTNVSWKDVQDYITWLNGRLGLSPDRPEKGFYRLPTEAEWEYAARGGVEGKFVPGDDQSKLCLYGNGADRSLNTMTLLAANNTCSDGKGRDLADVQSYKPNGFGLYDVHGNAWEWVQDCWTERLDPDKADGKASAGPDGSCSRVARGGSWRSAPEALRLAKRVPFPSEHARVTLGFRIARTLGESEIKRPN